MLASERLMAGRKWIPGQAWRYGRPGSVQACMPTARHVGIEVWKGRHGSIEA
jgi:hypothetical protein